MRHADLPALAVSTPQDVGVGANPALGNAGFTAAYIDAVATVTAGSWSLVANHATTGYTINLPATPADGDIVVLQSISQGGATCTIGRNGSNINGAAADNSLEPQMFAIAVYDAGVSSWGLSKMHSLAQIPTNDGIGCMGVMTVKFTGSGKTVGSSPYYSLTGLPDNAVVLYALVDVNSTFTSASDLATIGIGIETAGATGIVSPVAINAATDWDEGLHDCTPDFVAANAIKTTAAGQRMQFSVGVEDLTGGEMTVHLQYVVSAG